ncbi:MAG TPA: hypothetical protein VMW62_16245 [Chloroflexota bacterium]|nr:hypothetical protein [Chloroflexota bacterium]
MEQHPVNKDVIPFVVCAGLLVLSVFLVVKGHQQGDELAARATAVPTSVPTVAPQATSASILVTVTPSK